MCTLYGAGCGYCYCCWRMFWFWGCGERELVIKVKSCLLSMFSFFPFSIWPMQVSLKEALAVRAQLSWHSND
jgi:hypothetical protein